MLSLGHCDPMAAQGLKCLKRSGRKFGCISQPKIRTSQNATNVSKQLCAKGEPRQIYWNMQQHMEYILKQRDVHCAQREALCSTACGHQSLVPGQPPQFAYPFKLKPVCPGLFDTAWESFLQYRTCHKSREVSNLAREGKYGHFSAKVWSWFS